MSEIRRFPFLRHLRSEPSTHVMVYRRGELVREGRGLTAWFRPMTTGLAEVPIDDREMHFVFHGRSADFQDVTVQGVITYRVTDPGLLAKRVDFTIDLATGGYLKQPIERLELMVSQLAQQFAWAYIAGTPVRHALTEGTEALRTEITTGLQADKVLEEMGLTLVSVRISSIQPTADLERALEAPMREKIQQEADEAGFERRALAVENERAIQENELKNRIELARREEELITQKGQNSRREAREEAEAKKIEVAAAASRSRVQSVASGDEIKVMAAAEADQIRLLAAAEAESQRLAGAAEAESLEAIEAARVAAEKERLEAYGSLPPTILFGLAARELGKNLKQIDHLNLSPEALTPYLARLLDAGADRLGDGGTA